ncbi:M6 family metalloprotease domain-containing protein [Streptomyces mirabilis]|uniref:M6 family metalloprotease domain-containing protein n=1 Tax=Streptomyces mirabilis TaxID=68239 RepID=UPI00368B2134
MPRQRPPRSLAREARRRRTRDVSRVPDVLTVLGVPRVLARPGTLRASVGQGAQRWRSTAAVFTSMTALAATSLITGPALAEPLFSPCALRRTEAHHSEGLDTWNADYPRPTRPLDAVLVYLSFPDSRPRTTPAELAADYFPATSQFFERASYGRFTLRPHPQRDWIRMPHASTSYAIRRDWNAARRGAYLRDAVAAADRRVDFSRYDIVYFVADPDAPGVDSDATKVVNLDTPIEADGKDIRRVVTVFEKHPPDRLVLAHETGHVFDLPDLYHRPTDGKGDWDTYVGDWDLMGSQFGLAPDLFGWHKWKLGWLETRQVACLREHGTTRLTLEPLGSGPVTGGAGTAASGAPVSVASAGAQAGPAPALGSGGSTSDSEGSASGSGGSVPGPGTPGSGSVSGGSAPGSRARASALPAQAPSASAPSLPASRAVLPTSVPGARIFGSGRGTKLAVVRTGPDSALAFEARTSTGNDGATCTQGVLIYRIRSEADSGGGPVEVVDAHPHSESCWGESVYPPLADAPVGLGESFTVPGGKARVEVEDRTASGAWTVKITTG